MKISTRFSQKHLLFIVLLLLLFTTVKLPGQNCPTINEDGVFSPETDVLMTSYHQSMAKTTTGIVAWGEDMDSSGGNATTLTEVTPANGYTYSGTPLHFALSGNSDGQAFLATTVSLYAWGGVGEVVDGDFVSGLAFNDMNATQTLPFNAADITQMHASSDVLFVVSAGEVWVATTGATAPNGNASTNGNIWQQVQTSLGVPLTGVENVTGNKYAGYALMSNGDIYTWGDNVVIGDGTAAQNLDYATLMTAPPAPVKEISSFTHNDGDTGLLLLGTDTKVYGVGDNTLAELITTGSGFVTSWTAIQDGSGSDFTGAIQLSTSHTSEEWAAAAVLTEGPTPSDTNRIYTWGWNNNNSIGQGGNAVIQDPTIPPSFNDGTDDPVFVSVGGHATTFFNRAGGGSICFVGHITSGSTGGLTTGTGNVFECVIPATVELCGSQPTILALDDDFSTTPFDAVTGGTTPSVFADNGNGIDEADGVAATDANIDDNINISNDGGLTGVTINTDGTINVPAGSTAGTYTVEYTICLDVDNSICDTADVTIEIIDPCNISSITASNIDACSDNSTPSVLTDDTFTADITVTFTNAPTTGTLDLTGDGTATVSAVGLTSPHTFVDVVLPADGRDIDLTATFSADTSCTLNNANVFTAPFECSDDACPDVIPTGSPTAPLASGDVTFNITGTGGTAGAFLNSISVSGEPNPFTGIYEPSTVEYQFAIPAQTNQYMYNMGVLGSNINDTPAIFNAELLESYANKELTNYFSADNSVAPGIVPGDFVLIRYDAPITSAANRYMVATERDGNISYRIQALDAAGNPIGTERTTSVATYIDTGVQVDPTNFPGENAEASIYPLTAFVPSGSDIYGFRIRFRNSSSGDAGDGKVFVLYDPAFLTPPPTIEATTSAVQPTCPTNLGSITIDATDNGGGTIEYSVNGAAGPWQTSNVFNNLTPGTYTPAVRYQSTPTCLAESINPITLEDSGFNITAITASDITACNNNGTPSDISDDTFTADITVTFDGSPGTGTLDLTGDGTASVSAVGLTSPHTFNDIVFSANGNDVSLTAAFSDAPTCTFTDTAVFTAPTECSDDACNDAIPTGNPTAPLASGDVTFDITGTGGTAGAVLNSVTVTGEPNPFSGFYVPSTVNYSFANPAAANQYIYDMGTLGANITDGPAIFDPELLDAYRDRDLTNYLSTDNNIDPVDFVDFMYDAPIAAAANRYMVASERNGNNSYRIQALDATGNPIGALVVTSTGTYIDTGIQVDAANFPGQNIEMSIYPLTAFVTSGTDIYGFRIRFRNSSSGDGGDGKVFVMYDPAFLIPPPTIEPTTSAVQPTCPDNEGSITIDATDNGGGTIEYSINGAAGPWQTSNVFNNLPPNTYTPAVRYQSTQHV